MSMRRLARFALVALLSAPALADEMGEKIRAVFERARGNLVRVKFDQPTQDFGGGGGGGTRKANVAGFIADEETVVVVSGTLDMFGGPFRIRMGGPDGGDPAAEEEEEPSGFVAVLSDGREVPLLLRKKDPETGFAFLRVRNKEKAGALRPVVFAPSEPPLGDPVIVVHLSGPDMEYQPRFLLTRTNGVLTKGFPVYSTMESLGEFQGGLAYDPKGELVGVVGPVPRGAQPRRDPEEDGGHTIVLSLLGSGGHGAVSGAARGGARLLSGKWVSQALQTLGKKKEEPKGTEK